VENETFISAPLRDRHISTGASSDRKSLIFSPSTPQPRRKLKRSLSDGNLSVAMNEQRQLGITEKIGTEIVNTASIPITVSKFGQDVNYGVVLSEIRMRKKSKSMDSLRTASHFGHLGQPGALNSDWAEISSSTASLENASAIHVDGDNNSIGNLI